MFVFVFLMGFFFVLKNFVVRQGGKNWREKDNSNVFVCVVSWGNRGPNSRGSLVTRHRLFGSAHSQDKHISLLVSLFSYYTHTRRRRQWCRLHPCSPESAHSTTTHTQGVSIKLPKREDDGDNPGRCFVCFAVVYYSPSPRYTVSYIPISFVFRLFFFFYSFLVVVGGERRMSIFSIFSPERRRPTALHTELGYQTRSSSWRCLILFCFFFLNFCAVQHFYLFLSFFFSSLRSDYFSHEV